MTHRHTLRFHDQVGNLIEVGGYSFGSALSQLMHHYDRVFGEPPSRDLVCAIVHSADLPDSGGESSTHLPSGQSVHYTLEKLP